MSRSGGMKGLLCLWAFTLVWTCCSAQPVRDNAATKYRLHIMSEPLGQALQELAAQSGIQIVFFSQLTEGVRGRTLDGLYTITGALDILLAGSNLGYRKINQTTIQVVEKTSPHKRQPAHGTAPGGTRRSANPKVTSSGLADNLDEVTITDTAEHLVATRIATPLNDIPQTIAIISSEEIAQQSDTDLTDALRYAPGITVAQVDSMDDATFYSRGFLITSFHIDGGAALSPFFSYPGTIPIFLSSPDLSEFDHIEVLRGSDALFGGLGNPGGTVSLVRKLPRDTFGLSASLSTGSWSNDRTEADLTGPLGLDGALRGRLDGVFEDRDFSYGLATLERKRLFGVVEYDVTPATLVRVGGSYERDDSLPFVNGLPRAPDGSNPHLPVDTSMTFDWSRFRERMREGYLQIEQKVVSDWKLRIDAAQWNGRSTAAYGFWGSPIDPANRLFYLPPYSQVNFADSLHRQFAVDTTITGTLPWFSRRADVAFGSDYTRVHTTEPVDSYFSLDKTVAPAFPYEPSLYPSPYFETLTLGADLGATLTTRGIFASLRIPLTAALSVTAGTRVSSDGTHTNVDLTAPVIANASVRWGSSRVFTPYAGVMYAVDSHYSLYASYADIYQNQAETAAEPDGRVLGPESGIDRELGIKGAWREHTLYGTLVFFKITQDSVPLALPISSSGTLGPPYCCYQPGTSRSYGADIEIDGTPARGWLLTAGYTYDVNEAAAGGTVSAATPRHIVKLWTSKQFSGALDRFTIGGGLLAQSANSLGGSCAVGGVACPASGLYRILQGSYAVVDLRAGFRIDSHWQAALTLNNVLNRTYYQTLGNLTGGNWYGDPRNWQLRTEWRY